jgi:hypothetical protein
MGVIAVLAISLGLARADALLCWIWAVIAIIALARTRGVVLRRLAESRPLRGDEKVGVFIDSVLLVCVSIVISGFGGFLPGTLFGLLLGVAIGGWFVPGGDQYDLMDYHVGGALCGSLVGGLWVFTWTIRKLWKDGLFRFLFPHRRRA